MKVNVPLLKQIVITYDSSTPQNLIGVAMTVYFPSTSLRAGLGGAYEVTTDANGATLSTRKYYSIAGMTVAMNDGTGLQYLLTDHLGSVVATTNANGELVSQQRYLPFGQVRTDVTSPNASPTDLSYTGQRAVSGLGLQDYKFRFYDDALMRFVSPDDIIPDQSNPQSLNRFSYVNNQPVIQNDPTGHCPICIVIPLVGALLILNSIPSDTRIVQDNPTGELSFWLGVSLLSGKFLWAEIAADTYDCANGYCDPSKLSLPGSYKGLADSADDLDADATKLVTVRHYTDAAGKQAISDSGALRPGTYVTLPSEISPSAGHLQIEKTLETKLGRGTNYIDIEVPSSNLKVPEAGPVTSGDAWQRILTDFVGIDLSRWLRPPGRPGHP